MRVGQNILTLVDHESGQPWTIRVVPQGGAYDLKDCLTHDEPDPLVEFYAGRYLFDKDEATGTVLGQFVGRYYLRTLRERPDSGINLHGGEPSWTVSAKVRQVAIALALGKPLGDAIA